MQVLEVFGFVGRDDYNFDNSKSDIDFLVEFDEEGLIDYADNYFGLLESLEKLFNSPVDLVVGSSIKNPYFFREY